jgi:hypothetical protein
MVLSEPSLIARSFNSSGSFSSNCNSVECRHAARKQICDICKICPTVNHSSESPRDRKGIRGYYFISFLSSAGRSMQMQRKGRRKR